MNIIQVLFILLLVAPVLWGLINWYKYKSLPKPGKTSLLNTLINSAVLYALAFNLIFFLQELFLVLGKKSIGLTSYLYHNNHTWDGEHPEMGLMQGSGALAIFLIGILCLGIYQFIRKSDSIYRLLVLWLAFHGLTQSIPQVVIGYLDAGTDVGEALVGYMNLSEPTLIALSLSGILALPLVNILMGGYLLEFANDHADFDNPKARFRYIRFIAFGAGLLGCLLTIPFRIPPVNQIIAPFAVFAFSVPWIWASAGLPRKLNFAPSRINEKIFWTPIVLLVLLLIFFQVVLAPGVAF